MPATAGPVLPVESKPWQSGLAPVYIGLFLWIAFFDQIGRRTVPTAGLLWPALGAIVAGPLNYWLLFHGPAMWGQRTGRPLATVSTATFGTTGAKLVPGLLIGVAQVVWFAVAVGYGVDLTLRALGLVQLVDPRTMRSIAVGGGMLPSVLVMTTSLVWCVVVALVGGWFSRWIAALMQVFPIFPALLLGAMMLLVLVGLRDFRPDGVDALTGERVSANVAGPRALLLTIQAVFAFTAMAGITAADWGAASLGPRDVRLGGWVGLGLAPAVVVLIALVTVAGAHGKRSAESAEAGAGWIDAPLANPAARAQQPVDPSRDVPLWTFRDAIVSSVDRRLACVMFLVFGLASLAPACFAAFDFGHRFKRIAPGVNRLTWTVLGALAAWFLIAGGWHERTDAVFAALGALFAPVAGAMAADRWRHRGEWPGARRGVNPSGLVAWGLGLLVGLIPVLGRELGFPAWERFQPASVWAFAVAFAAQTVLARLGFESGRDLSSQLEPE